jgi:hypothetical protein
MRRAVFFEGVVINSHAAETRNSGTGSETE